MNARLQQLMSDYVMGNQGCKATELVANVTARAIKLEVETESILDDLDAMIVSGELVEVCYTLPNMPDREKQFLLPKGSKLQTK